MVSVYQLVICLNLELCKTDLLVYCLQLLWHFGCCALGTAMMPSSAVVFSSPYLTIARCWSTLGKPAFYDPEEFTQWMRKYACNKASVTCLNV